MRHEPAGYDCPFCKLVSGGEGRWNTQSDVVWRDALTTAFVSPKWWPGNEGHAIVIPNAHVENLYSTRQHNEPAVYQDVWHLHVHVFPRYDGDGLYTRHAEARWAEEEERAPHAERLRRALAGL